MPRRRRQDSNEPETPPSKQLRPDSVVFAARGRFKEVLLDALEDNVGGDSDSSLDLPTKTGRSLNDGKLSRSQNDFTSDEDDSFPEDVNKVKRRHHKPHKNNSYVMKLFDRSVDLAQFTEDTPLYTICRAWMANKPRSYNKRNTYDSKNNDANVDGIKLPPPKGYPVSRVPPLLPDQCSRSKYNINLNYNEFPPPSKELLLQSHLERWHAVRKKWLQQAVIYESRYSDSQDILNEMDTE